MTTEIRDLVKEIDGIVRQQKWFDFHVLSYDGFKLTIGGSIDLNYYHSLEIIFNDVFFVSGFFKGWHSDTHSDVFLLPDNEIELNRQFEIEQGYQLFVFKTEDHKSDFTVAAKSLSFNTDTVFYYDRQDLKENERIADFVKKAKTINQ